MCGIAGILNLDGAGCVDAPTLRGMLAQLAHRGPDGEGLYTSGPIGLAHARLSIVDLAGGQQPIANEDETVWIICNGEIFNYPELREELARRGHRFRTRSDSEVIVHLYEERGPACVDALVGDFAFAIWDSNERRLVLTRDRLGVRPLFVTEAIHGQLRFASEIKALLVDPSLPRQLDPVALDQVFTYWSTLPGRTMFQGIREVPPGEMVIVEDGKVAQHRYWQLKFQPDAPSTRDLDECAEQLRALLVDATLMRLRADVPVGAYLSGGLDSSVITALVREYAGNTMETFSVAFADPRYDERGFQETMARALGTRHNVLEVGAQEIGEAFPDIIRHTEAPLLRTSPVPMMLLSRFVRQHGLKVVLTGEGADEFLAGYNIFKETKVRAFWARQPQSVYRPLLLRRLYGYVGELQQVPQAYLRAHFGQGLDETEDPAYSHLVRWRTTARLTRFFSDELQEQIGGAAAGRDLDAVLAAIEPGRDAVSRAQHVEASIFLPQYLLSSQGDRVAMANAVEGRFPFLDHRVVEFCNTLPTSFKLRGFTEKYLLKRAMNDLIPDAISSRPKQPYRAPIADVFLGQDAPSYVRELLSPNVLRQAGYFRASAVTKLLEKGRRHGQLGEMESMALCGVISTQLLHHHFVDSLPSGTAASDLDPAPRSLAIA
jgi:asparagine synthase (glutamine-hydrolysing)